MQVEVIDCTSFADETICKAARGDYMTEYIGDMSFEEIMEGVTYNTDDEAWAREHLAEFGADFESIIEAYAKIHGFLRKLAKRGHFGPFEHATMTFAVKGVSRTLMAQLTRHRVASFDVQSFRYTVPDKEFISEIVWGGRPLSDLRELVVVPPSYIDAGLEEDYLMDCLGDFEAYFHYMDELNEAGYSKKLAAQDARFKLPQGVKCNLTFTVNVRSLMHIADMRGASDAQWEIRDMTNRVLEEAENFAPAAMHVYNTELKGRKNRLAP